MQSNSGICDLWGTYSHADFSSNKYFFDVHTYITGTRREVKCFKLLQFRKEKIITLLGDSETPLSGFQVNNKCICSEK